jgi:hypothetical protein
MGEGIGIMDLKNRNLVENGDYAVLAVNSHEGLVAFKEKVASLHRRYRDGELNVNVFAGAVGRALAAVEGEEYE